MITPFVYNLPRHSQENRRIFHHHFFFVMKKEKKKKLFVQSVCCCTRHESDATQRREACPLRGSNGAITRTEASAREKTITREKKGKKNIIEKKNRLFFLT
jgi:hypothetical protein